MAIKAVIWDMGGVLLRTEDATFREKLAQRVGMDRFQLEERVFGGDAGRRAQRGEGSSEEHWQQLGTELGVPDVQGLQVEFFAGDRLDMQLIEFIRSLRPRYRVGLLSNALTDLRPFLTDILQIGGDFDELIISAEVGLMKPDPRIYQIALQRLQVAPEEAVFIDDFQHNIDGAQAVGLHGIRFINTDQVLADLQALLDAEVSE
jgi:epoxide hydrolase-like predicted phosphatase